MSGYRITYLCHCATCHGNVLQTAQRIADHRVRYPVFNRPTPLSAIPLTSPLSSSVPPTNEKFTAAQIADAEAHHAAFMQRSGSPPAAHVPHSPSEQDDEEMSDPQPDYEADFMERINEHVRYSTTGERYTSDGEGDEGAGEDFPWDVPAETVSGLLPAWVAGADPLGGTEKGVLTCLGANDW
jgi:hypothetical protein